MRHPFHQCQPMAFSGLTGQQEDTSSSPFQGIKSKAKRFTFALLSFLLFSSPLQAQTVIEYGSYLTGGGGSANFTEDETPNMFEDATGLYYVTVLEKPGMQTTPGAYQSDYGGGDNDLVLIKVDHTGQVVWSTYLGGGGDEGSPDPGFRVDNAFLVEGDAIYVTAESFFTGALPGFNFIDPSARDNLLVAKFNALTGALEWGTAIPKSDTGPCRPRDIYVENDKVYVSAQTFTNGDYFYTTPDALESTGNAYFTILDGGTGTIDYATYYNGGSDYAEMGQIAVAGNILALTGYDDLSTTADQRNTTVDALESMGSLSNLNGFLAYFDLTTRQIVFDTYTSAPEVDFDMSLYLETDGTRFYYLSHLERDVDLNSDFFVNPPYNENEPTTDNQFDFFANWMQVWNVDKTLETSFNTLTNGANDDWGYFTLDAANNRYFVHGYGRYMDFPAVNPIEPFNLDDLSNPSGSFIVEYQTVTNNVLFSQYFPDTYFGVYDVEIDASGNLYMIIELGNFAQLDQFTTPGGLSFSPSFGYRNLFVKLDANRDLVYGTYLFQNNFDNEDYSRLTQINVLEDNLVEVYGTTFATGTSVGRSPVTADGQYPSNGGRNDAFYYRFNFCPETSENSISPVSQIVCTDGLAQVINGSQVTLDPPYPDYMYDNSNVSQGANVGANYQWQVSFDEVTWSDIPGATTKDFLPAPTSVDVFFRRLAGPLSDCCMPDTSNVHAVMVNGLPAPSLEDGQTFACPNSDITIGLPASGGAGGGNYSYLWNPATGLNDATLAQPTFNGALGGIYTVIVTDIDNGCQFEENWEVVVATADAGEDQNICPGEDQAVVIGLPAPVSDLVSYSWDVMPGGDDISSLNDPNVAQPLASPGVTTMYQLTTTVVATGCSTNSMMTVFVGDDPGATAGPDLVLCLGEDAVLGGETDQPGFTYGWAPGLYIDNQNVAQPNFMSSLCTTDDPFLATGNPLVYTVTKIDNVSGCVDIDTVEIVLLQIDLYNQKSNCMAPALIGDRQAECGLDLPDVTFLWTIVEGDLTSLDLLDETMPTLTVDPAGSTLYQLQVFYDGVGYCTDTVRVSPDCVLGCSIALNTTSDINCPVGGDFNTTISAIGNVEGVDINSLPPGYTFEWVPTTALASPASTTTAVGNLGADQTYTFNVRNPNGDILCTESIDVFATAAANPIVGIPPSVEGCLDAEITIGVPEVAGWAYEWSPADDLDDANLAQPTLTVTQDREYMLVATDIVTGCEYRDTVEVVVAQPFANAGPDRTFCENAIVTLGTPAIPNYSYSWTPSLGLTEPNVAQPTDTIFASVTYFLEVTDDLTGCIALDTVTFTITTAPDYDAPDVTICESSGGLIGLPAQPGFSYFWSPVTGLSDPTAAQPFANPTSNTTYTVVVSDGNPGCYAADQVAVTVVPSSFSLELNDISDCVGTTVNIGIPDQGGTYSWSPIIGLSNPAISNPEVTIGATEATYILTWDTPDGCPLVDTVVITPIVDEAIDFVMAYEICEGESVVIGDDTEDLAATYSWSVFLGDDISSLSSTSVYNPTATPDQTTIYELTFTSATGCVQTKAVTVSVVPLPPAVDLGTDIISCVDEVLTIPAIGDLGGADYTESFEVDLGGWTQNTDDAFDWTRDSGGTPTTLTGPTTGSNGTDFYLFTEVSPQANATSAIITSPAIPVGAATTTMSFDYHMYQRYSNNNHSLQLEISNDGGTNWYSLWFEIGDQGNQWRQALIDVSAFAGSTVNLRFTGTKGTNSSAFRNERGDMAIDGIQFSGNTVPDVLWSTGATTNMITVSPSGNPVTYSVTVSYGSCSVTDEIIVSPPFTVDAGEDQFYCPGAEVVTIGTPDASGGALTYSWSIVSGPGPLPAITNTAQIEVEPTGTTTYLLTVDDGNGCILTDQVSVTRTPGDVFDLGPDQTICTGGCVDIGLVDDTDFSYNWVPTTDIMGSTTQSMATVCPTVTTEYVLEITDLFYGCTYRDTIEVIVLPDALDAADAGLNAVVCEGEEVTLGTPDASGGTINYNWTISPGSGPGPLPAVTNTAQIDVTPTATTTYLLSIDDGGACMSTDEVTVTILDNPAPVDLGSDQTVCINGCIVIGIPEVAGNSYQWSPTTGITDPTQSQITVCPTADITYTLFATNDQNACTLSDDITLTLSSDPAPTANAGEDVSICSGETVQIGAPSVPGQIYLWSPTTGLANSAQGDPTFVGNTPGDYTYFLTVVDQVSNCISMTDTVVVTVTLPPNPTIAAAGPFCQGGVVPINATVSNTDAANLAYSWFPAGIFEDATVEDPIIVNLTSNTNITLFATNTVTGCVASASTLVSISTNTLEVELLPDVAVCEGEEVILGVNSLTTTGIEVPGGDVYSESFESGLGGWTQSTNDNMDWTRDSGGTPTNNTGPSSGASGSNWYLYTEASGNSNRTAIIESPSITLSTTTNNMSFEYHMFGLFIGSLSLEVSTDGGLVWAPLWSIAGAQGNQWLRAVIDMSAYSGTTINIRFIGMTGPGTLSDIAIDDIRFSGNTLPVFNYAWISADQGSTSFTDDGTYFVSGQNSDMPSVNTSSEDFDRTYQLIVTNTSSGCAATDEVNVTVNGPLAIIEAGNDAFVCGDSYTMTATPPGDSPIVGTWSQVSGPTATFSDVNDPVTMISGLAAGTYEFLWTITGSCEDGSDAISIEVVDPPALVTNVTCTPSGMVDLTVAEVTEGSMLDGANLSYWLNAAATNQVPDATNVLAGTYYIRAFNPSTSCSVVVPVMVGMSPIVTVAAPAIICSTQTIDLTQGASILPADLGGTWSSSGNGTFTVGTDFATAMTYTLGSEDIAARQVTLTLTSNDPDGPCTAVPASVTFTILPVDCGDFPWDGN